MTPFRILYGRDATATIDAVLQHKCNNGETDAEYITQLAEQAREIAHA